MGEITTKSSKKLTLTNKIMVDGIQTVLQSYTLNTEDASISRSEPIINQDLYKDNRAEIRAIMADFEDYAYQEQDNLIPTGAVTTDLTKEED